MPTDYVRGMAKLRPFNVELADRPTDCPERFTVVKRPGSNQYSACSYRARGPHAMPPVPAMFRGSSIEDITDQIQVQWPEVTGCQRRLNRVSPSKFWQIMPRVDEQK